MRPVVEFLANNAVDLMLGIAFFLVVYLIARLLKASPLLATCCGILPFAILYLGQHPSLPLRLWASIS